MVGSDLRALVTAATGSGSLEGDDVLHGSGEHPVCGDLVEVDVRLDGAEILDMRWRARGCPATFAAAAAAAQVLPGSTVQGAAAALRGRLAELGDLAAHERHAEALLLRAVTAAASGGAGS